MFSWFLPRETNYFDLFEKHIDFVIQGAETFASMTTDPSTALSEKAKEIKRIEHEADQVVHQCVESLHTTFITPIERNDIFRLISNMDDIIDYLHTAADRLVLYQLNQMTTGAKELSEILLKATRELKTALKKLRDLSHKEAIKQICINIHYLENEGDFVLRQAMMALLADEQKNVLAIIKWKEIYENLEDAIDSCEDVANIIEGVILEYS